MFRKALFLVLVLPVIGAVIAMSCGKTERYICNDVAGFSMIKDSASPLTKPITIKLEIYDKYARGNCYLPGNNPFISGCYAMQPPCIKWLNDIKWSSIKMTFDKPMAIDGDTLQPGENFLEHPLVNGKNKFQKEAHCHGIDYTLELTEGLVKKMAFDTGLYNITLSCETTDNRIVDDIYTTTFQ